MKEIKITREEFSKKSGDIAADFITELTTGNNKSVGDNAKAMVVMTVMFGGLLAKIEDALFGKETENTEESDDVPTSVA